MKTFGKIITGVFITVGAVAVGCYLWDCVDKLLYKEDKGVWVEYDKKKDDYVSIGRADGDTDTN